jgi:capsular polysaccharide transport system permease protein
MRARPVRAALIEDSRGDLAARRLKRRQQKAAEGKTGGLPQSLLDQLPVLRTDRPDRPVMISNSGRIEQRLTVTRLREVPANRETLEGPVAPPRGRLKQRRRNYGEKIWFGLAVVLPVAIATIYYALIASNQYVAEFRFAVKDASISPAMSSTSSLMSMIGGGSSNAYDNYLVADYLISRQAAEEVQQRINVTQLYARPEADWWARFDPSDPMEKFVTYWQSMVSSHYDQVTGIAIAQIKAFRPDDALLIANTLVTLSEELVNKIASRTQNDAVRFAQKEVDRAEERLKAIRSKITDYRNKVGVIDPASSVVASNSQLVQGLKATLAQLETQVQTLRLQNLQPTAPAMMTLQNQINSTKAQLSAIEGSVSTTAKDGRSLSNVIAEFEQLDLERQFAQNMVTSTMAALDQARASAAAQHLYITPYVRPSLPEMSLYPRRILAIVTVAGLALIVWLIGLLIGRSMLERMG